MVLVHFFELFIGIGALAYGLYLYLTPPCKGRTDVCIGPAMLLGAGSVTLLDGARRLCININNGDLRIVFGGAKEVRREDLDGHVAMSVMEPSFSDPNRKKGFSSAHSLNAVQDLVDTQVKTDHDKIMVGGKLKQRKAQRRCLLADARLRLLQDLFQYYSKGGDTSGEENEPCINCNGLVEVMLDTMTTGAESITLDESKKFMARIDLDKDMLLQSNEFYSFLFNIWENESPLFLNNVYATLGDMIYALHSKHIGKTSTIAKTLLDVTTLKEEELQLLMVERLRDIYVWYDEKKTGAIDCNGLMKLVSDLVANKPEGELTLGEVKKFLEQVDDNGDMLLQSDELVMYMQTTWLADAPSAEGYDDYTAFIKDVYPKYQNLLRERWKKKNGFDADDLPNATLANNLNAAKDMLQIGQDGSQQVSPPSGLPPIIQQKLKVLIETLWECYASKMDAELNSEQLKSLLDDHITSSKVPYEECQRFIQCMDLDGNESISKEEFETFVSRGLFMDDEQKKVYRERSDMHIHLVEFLGRIEEQVTAQEISEETSISFNGKDEKKIIDTTSEDTKKIDNENDKTTENSTDETIINVDETINQFEQEENAKKKEEEEEEKKNEKKEEEA